jgi:hypothetical protein
MLAPINARLSIRLSPARNFLPDASHRLSLIYSGKTWLTTVKNTTYRDGLTVISETPASAVS